jgi:hypothetical protein
MTNPPAFQIPQLIKINQVVPFAIFIQIKITNLQITQQPLRLEKK